MSGIKWTKIMKHEMCWELKHMFCCLKITKATKPLVEGVFNNVRKGALTHRKMTEHVDRC